MSNEISKQEQFKLVSERLNQSVLSVIGNDSMLGFEKAYQIANAIDFLKANITDDYMKPIMAMQGTRLGFKTDKDNQAGYPISKVKECLIDAVLTGVQPYGNQFNIIAGNMYVTKEGYGHLLSKVKGLKYSITPALPRISTEKASAAVEMNIKWTFKGEEREEKVDFAIKVNSFMGADAVIGKATRKARAWLFNQVSDIEVTDGDVDDVEFTLISSKPNVTVVSDEEKELQRLATHLKKVLTTEALDELENSISNISAEQKALIDARRTEITKKSK